MLTVSGRDFVLLAGKKIDQKDGSIKAVAVSIEDERVPAVKKYVRAELKVKIASFV